MNKKKEKKITKKKMTLDGLAVLIAGSFSGLEERLTKKIGDVENKLEGTNKRIDDFAETKASKITFKELKVRVEKLELNAK